MKNIKLTIDEVVRINSALTDAAKIGQYSSFNPAQRKNHHKARELLTALLESLKNAHRQE
jgi:hypothetical protein